MEDNSKKDLTNCQKECTIWLKLKELCKDKQYGQLDCKVIIHGGRIAEIKHRDFEGSIRG